MLRQTHGEQIKLIFAEDDDAHADLMMEQLKICGVRNPCVRLRDGQEVLDYFLGQPDAQATEEGCILFLDVRMPKVDGLEVLRSLKADPRHKNIPVIIFTSASSPREVERSYELGCSGYVVKETGGEISFLDRIKRLAQFVEMLTVINVPTPGAHLHAGCATSE